MDYLGIFDDVAGVLDFDEKAVGWSMVTHLRTEQVVSVLRMTIGSLLFDRLVARTLRS